jgi:hypothetical protein
MGTVNKLLQRFITAVRWVASRPGDAEFAAFVCRKKRRCWLELVGSILEIVLHPPLHRQKKKSYTTFLIAELPLFTWCRRDESNTRPSHYE